MIDVEKMRRDVSSLDQNDERREGGALRSAKLYANEALNEVEALRIALGSHDAAREERLTRYRCAAPIALAARGIPRAWDATDIALEIESIAHAMLAAERPADATALDDGALRREVLSLVGAFDAYRGNIEGTGARDLIVSVDGLRTLLPPDEKGSTDGQS